jgi:hypothetical protein
MIDLGLRGGADEDKSRQRYQHQKPDQGTDFSLNGHG